MASNELVASSGASHILGVSTNTVRAWMRRGDLPIAAATPVGFVFFRDDVIRLAAQRAQREAARADREHK